MRPGAVSARQAGRVARVSLRDRGAVHRGVRGGSGARAADGSRVGAPGVAPVRRPAEPRAPARGTPGSVRGPSCRGNRRERALHSGSLAPVLPGARSPSRPVASGGSGVRYVAVEPSAEAIADGEARFPAIEFRRGLLGDLPLADGETFDLVIASFVLHWVDRRNLLRAAAEIDRATADGGTVAVADFLPDRPARVLYHHLPEGGMYTFKQDYAALFAAAGTYRIAGRWTFDHTTHEFRANGLPSDRCAVTLLVKNLTGLYEDRGQP